MKTTRRTFIAGLSGIATAAAAATGVASSPAHPDAELIVWGEEMERLLVIFNQADDGAISMEQAWSETGMRPGTDAYWAFTGPTNEKACRASDAVEAVATLIREKEAATPAGLLVKAKALRWDACLYGDDEQPIEEWDWDKECVHRFIAELARFAIAHPMT